MKNNHNNQINKNFKKSFNSRYYDGERKERNFYDFKKECKKITRNRKLARFAKTMQEPINF